MPRIERSVTIARSVPDVFSYMDDVDREHEWQPNLRAASQEPRGPVVYESTPESATQATAEVRWEQVPEGTMVTMSIDAAPGRALKLMPGKALQSATTKELERMLGLLKEVLEGGPG